MSIVDFRHGHLYLTDDYICEFCQRDLQDVVVDHAKGGTLRCERTPRQVTLPMHSYQRVTL